MPRPGRPMQVSDAFLRITQAQLVSPRVGAGTSTGSDHGPAVVLLHFMKVDIGAWLLHICRQCRGSARVCQDDGA